MSLPREESLRRKVYNRHDSDWPLLFILSLSAIVNNSVTNINGIFNRANPIAHPDLGCQGLRLLFLDKQLWTVFSIRCATKVPGLAS